MSSLENLIIVRGGGDLATGTIYKLHQCGLPVLVLETANPSAIRRNVAFSEAVYLSSQTVEGMTCSLASSIPEAKNLLKYSTMNVQEIAYSPNFPNQSFFGKYFKPHTGMTPSQYKRL